MSTHTEAATDSPIITMTRFYSAPRSLVWQALTEPRHVMAWWGGPGCRNALCDMDVRPGGHWKLVTQLQSGPEVSMDAVYLEVEAPSRLHWAAAPEAGQRGAPAPRLEVTLEELGMDTLWTLVARFSSLAERDAALAQGFTGPLEGGAELLGPYLDALGGRALRLSARPPAPPSVRTPRA